jgi:TP901 family phage tail tape measure protein
VALNSSNFQILVAATLDAANIQKQLDTISKRYKTIKINLDVDTTSLNNATNSLNNCKQSITETGKAAQGTSQSIGDIVSKVTKFGAATLIINKFRQAIVDGYGAVKELDASVTEYRKVSELTDSQMGGFIDTARELGLTVARTADEMVEAATEFKKMGNDDSTSLELGRLATMFQNIADEAVSAGDSASFINSQMKAFNFTANEAIHVLDAVNKVANNFAVSSGDISTALPKVASTMALAGNSFEETIGLLTAGAELIPNQASRIARGLRSITLNLQGLNEDGEQVAGMAASMQEEFDKLGISLLDEQGQIKSTYEIFSELAEIFPKLDKNTQTYYASLIGGKTQVDVVTAILKNFETALNATDTAINSVGSAMEENEKYMDSIQGKIAALNSEFQKFWTEGISSNSVKRIVEFGTGILKLVNDLGGLPTILTAVVGIIATLKGYSLVNYITKITKSITSTIGVIKGLQAEGFTLINVFNGMTSAATKFQIAAGALTLIITATVGIMASLKQKQEEARNAALQAGEAFNSQAQDLNNLLEKYNDIWDSEDSEGEKAKQLAELRETLATQYGLEKDALDNLNGSREAGNKLLNDEIQKRAESTYAQYLSEIQKAQEYLTRTDFSVTLPITIDENTFKDETRNKINQIFGEMAVEFDNGVIAFQGGSEKLKNAMEQAIIYLSKLKEPTENESLLLASLQHDLTKVAEGYNDNTEVIQKYAEVIARNTPEVTKFINGQYETKEAMEEAKKVALNSVGPFKEIKTAIENLANTAFPEFIVSQEETTTGTHNQKDEAGELAKTLKELSGELSGVQGAYDTLSEVAKEYNETGSLTATTLANLLKLNPEYLQALSMENGQLIVNTDMLNQMAQGYVTSAYKALTGVTGISAFGNALEGTATAGEAAAQRIAEAGNAAITAGQKAFEGAKGFESLIGSIAAFAGTLKAGISGDKGDGTRDYGHGFDSQVAAYQENERKKFYEDLIAKMHIDTSGGSKKGGGGGGKDSAEKAAKEAAKAYKEEFEKRISEIKFKFDMGDVTELGYWKEVDKIVQEFYANNEAYTEEYRDWTAKIQKGMVSGTKANYNLERDALEHKLAMDLISEEEFYKELEKLRQEYYAQDPIYAAESEAIEEEIYAFKKKKIKDLAEERKRQRKKEWDEETDWLNEQKSRYETAFNYIDSLAQKEIDALEEQKQAIEDKYNAEIDKINETNDALNDEIALQEKLEALAKAQNKKVRIYREGQGFVYENDQSAVDEAKAALTQYQKEQDTKKEIKRLEDIRDATIESVEEQIEYWEKYRDEWKDMVNSYTEQQNKLIAEQVLGISLEGENWEKRLGNLQDYVDRYNSILSQLKRRGDYDDEDFDDDYDYGTGGSGGTAGGGGTIGPSDHAGSGGHWDSSDSSHGPGVAANGTTTGHGLTMVGEKGRELKVLGSGTNEGDGIVPNHLTENLMKLGQYSPREWINALTHNPGNQQCSTQYSYAFDSLVLPNVTNADSFISELKNIKNQAIQMGGRRF